MKKSERTIWVFVALALLIMLLIEKCQHGKTSPAGAVSIVTSVRVDTILGDEIYRNVPIPYFIHDTTNIIDTLVKVDTVTIERIKEKLVRSQIPVLYFPDTLRFGDKGYVALNDTVQGLILARSFNYKLFLPSTTIKETKPEKQRLKLYAGIEYAYPMNYIGAGAILQLKNDNLLKVGYGYANGKPQYSAGYYFKIKLK